MNICTKPVLDDSSAPMKRTKQLGMCHNPLLRLIQDSVVLGSLGPSPDLATLGFTDVQSFWISFYAFHVLHSN